MTLAGVTLAVLALLTTTWAGMWHVVRFTLTERPDFWSALTVWHGLTLFALPLLAVMAVHEYAHLWACRRADVPAYGPFFIPWPGWLIGLGGAFIWTTRPSLTRRGAFWIGASGPIAGFAVSLAVLAVGLALSHPGRTAPVFDWSPLVMSWLTSDTTVFHPLALVGRYGLLWTCLNMLPVPPLDGWRMLRACVGPWPSDPHPLPGRVWRVATVGMLAVLCWPV